MMTKTLAEILESQIPIYPSSVDQATQNIINDWFYFRHVTDNDRFPVYFRRVLNRDYSRYKEMMRIEAGQLGDTGRTTEFDWLVTNYFEGYSEDKGTHDNRVNNSNIVNNTDNHSNITVNGGDDITIRNGSDNYTHGQYVDSSGTNLDNSRSSHKGDSASNAETRAGALARTQPMSAAYTQADLNANDSRRGYITDKTKGYNVGEKEYEPETDSSYVVGLHRNFPELNIKNPTSASDAFTGVGSIGKEKSNDENSGQSSHSEHSQYGGTDSRVSGDTSRVTHGATVNVTGNGNSNSSTSGLSVDSGSNSNISKQVNTGRGGEIADILGRARRYIEETSAIEWLVGQVESCFMDLDYGKE